MYRWVGFALAASMLTFSVAAEETAPLGSANGFSNASVNAWGGEEVEVSYKASRARMIAAGYREVVQMNGDALKLTAFDPKGCRGSALDQSSNR